MLKLICTEQHLTQITAAPISLITCYTHLEFLSGLRSQVSVPHFCSPIVFIRQNFTKSSGEEARKLKHSLKTFFHRHFLRRMFSLGKKNHKAHEPQPYVF